MKEFSELISNHLTNLMEKVMNEQGHESAAYKALYYQYVKTENECGKMKEHNEKHYEAIVDKEVSGLRFVERLYKRQATVDLTMACCAHCRYCLRQNYGNFYMSPEDESEIVSYLARDPFLKEVLITGGDPLLDYEKLIHIMGQIIAKAGNIKIIRIGTRLPVQNPLLLNDKLLQFFSHNKDKVFLK